MTWGETVRGLKPQAYQELRMVGKDKDRPGSFQTMFEFNVHQWGACDMDNCRCISIVDHGGQERRLGWDCGILIA